VNDPVIGRASELRRQFNLTRAADNSLSLEPTADMTVADDEFNQRRSASLVVRLAVAERHLP